MRHTQQEVYRFHLENTPLTRNTIDELMGLGQLIEQVVEEVDLAKLEKAVRNFDL
jgi:hypothetical protein